eukprot:TRINITY_DN5203_c0_g1_i2.p1 TRINITY_DN5203_c0_g1~~TRINITY_DN5203_c0_g1_i2.p1  ORF type:complete len:194 (-),score=29.93 TRINITY_DN5203_c0_g1_i2:567-1148(-)
MEIPYVVVACSSQAVKHPATKVREPEGRWETAEPEEEAMIDVMMERPSQIGQIRIENAGAALIEILVKNKSEGEKSWKVLQPVTLICSLADSLAGTKLYTNSTLCRFTKDSQKEWEMIRVVLRQPWTSIPIGLTRLSIFPPTAESPSEDNKLVKCATPSQKTFAEIKVQILQHEVCRNMYYETFFSGFFLVYP